MNKGFGSPKYFLRTMHWKMPSLLIKFHSAVFTTSELSMPTALQTIIRTSKISCCVHKRSWSHQQMFLTIYFVLSIECEHEDFFNSWGISNNYRVLITTSIWFLIFSFISDFGMVLWLLSRENITVFDIVFPKCYMRAMALAWAGAVCWELSWACFFVVTCVGLIKAQPEAAGLEHKS